MRGNVSGDFAIASASDMPSTTKSWTSRHLADAAGLDDSLQRITSARLNGTPAASKLESRRVKFSSALPETFCELNLNEKFPSAGTLPFFAAPFFEADSARLTGRRPRVSICRK